jgi:TIR domain
MAGLFLSHASADKPFVTRLAIDLVGRGMPVWFDTWEMDTGDSFEKKIYDGIDSTDYLILVLSPSSVASGWVQKELTAALALEERDNRTVVLPILLGLSRTTGTLGVETPAARTRWAG